jgi:8-amino-7-oxononanoate synthase
MNNSKSSDSRPGANGAGHLEARKRSRAAFLEPFGSLIEEVEAARALEVYPFYASADPMGPSTLAQPVVLVANDYLGLSRDERVRDAAREAIARFGTSRCSSPLAGGYSALHHELESRIARFLDQEAALLFASGYQANVGIVSSLVGRGDLILTDLLNHASIIDGARLSGAEVRFFQHNSASHLKTLLGRSAEGRRTLVIVEGIYSADGDIVCLPEICQVAHAHGALVMIDEAHSLGVLGERGRGAAEHFGLLKDVDLIMGTMSKTLASVGGFLAADRRIVDTVAHSARALIFSAALPPAGVAAALTSLGILESEPGRRERLWRNAQIMLDGLEALGFDTMGSVTPVVPILVGDQGRAIEFTAGLRKRGIFVCPAIPPMVQARRSRVRGHVTAAHDEALLRAALPIIDEVGRALGLTGQTPGRPAGARTRIPRTAPAPARPAE